MKFLRKSAAILTALVMLFGVCTVTSAAEVFELIKNGGFETLKEDGTAADWYISVQDFYAVTDDAHEGKSAVKMYGGTTYALQNILKLVGGTDYTFTAWIKHVKKAGSGPAIKLEFYNQTGSDKPVSLPDTSISEALKDTGKVGEWSEVTIDFTAPEQANRVGLLLRNFGAGEVIWDDISMKGQTSNKQNAETPAPKAEETVQVMEIGADVPKTLLPMFDGASELLTNRSFESVGETGIPTDWRTIFTKTNADGSPCASITDEMAHTGTRSLKLKTESNNLPYAAYLIRDVEEGAVLQTSMWVYLKKAVNPGICFKYEFYDINDVMAGHGVPLVDGEVNNSTFFKSPTDGWTQYSDVITVPKGAKSLAVYFRSYGAGESYIDDVSCYKVGNPVELYLDTDDVIYYSEVDHGVATARVNTDFYPESLQKTVGFKLIRNGQIVNEQASKAFVNGAVKYGFDISWLADKEEQYDIEATLYNGDGSISETKKQDIYRYDRPGNMGTDGVITKNGVRIENPVYSYGAYNMETTWPMLSKVGINVVQGSVNKEALDKAQKQGIYILGMLYSNMFPAGHPNNKENTISKVTQFKNHPALIGWMVMDEYHYQIPTTNRYLTDSYRLIRSIDKDNPIFCMECSQGAKTGRYVDILGYDPYPQGAYPVASYIGQFTDWATNNTAYRKPVWCLNQSFEYKGYYPTVTDERSMWYQALFEGADALGHYRFERSKGTLSLDKTEIWDGLVQHAETEADESFKHFAYRQYPIFKEAMLEDIWCSLYVKEGELHAVILNTNDQNKTFSIALQSDCGTVSIGGFTAELIAGDGEKTVSGNSNFTAEIKTNDVLVYKIVPTDAVDYTSLKTTKFRDLITHPWAASAVRMLEEKGVINGISENFYGPSIAINRADFAYFLIRTLGLTADASEGFADVDRTAYYAKEIAIGKALGILKGIGDNRYNPFEEISRQDMMVICARGIRLKKAIDEGDAAAYLATFTDSTVVADYAVADIAAMVRINIVKGNADGTLNPLGNTTRAETAVIMNRILEWTAQP